MKLSKQRTTALYQAICEPITQLRIANTASEHPIPMCDLDERLYRIQHKIWREVHTVLNLEGLP